MITNDSGRLTEFLWFVGYCGEFPNMLESRIGGHSEWNRHVKYQALKLGYVEATRHTHKQRLIKSLRLTEEGLKYLCSRDPKAASYLPAAQNGGLSRVNRARSIARLHTIAAGLVMAYQAGAEILPDHKPSLLYHAPACEAQVAVDPETAYYYSPKEIRTALKEFDPDSVSRTSRMIGIIVRDKRCFCLYYCGRSRIPWMQQDEDHTAAAIDALLAARGFSCTSYSQVLITSHLRLALSIAGQRSNSQGKYFTPSSAYNHCYFVENSPRGDWLLKILLQPELHSRLDQKLFAPYLPLPSSVNGYAAQTPDGLRPILLAYPFDLLALMHCDLAPKGYRYSPILLCFDYQADTIQRIVGPKVEVRPCTGGTEHEQEEIWKTT